jgi:tripartite-type tricarboxylate transporter receptor subunit TctC
MERSRRRLVQSLLFGLAVAATGVQAQTFPDRPLKLVVPFPPGGATDVLGMPRSY